MTNASSLEKEKSQAAINPKEIIVNFMNEYKDDFKSLRDNSEFQKALLAYVNEVVAISGKADKTGKPKILFFRSAFADSIATLRPQTVDTICKTILGADMKFLKRSLEFLSTIDTFRQLESLPPISEEKEKKKEAQNKSSHKSI